jgi:CBS domain-containing protein
MVGDYMAKHITQSNPYIKYSKSADRKFEESYILDADYILSEVKGIKGKFDRKLRRVGLFTTKDLLKRCRNPTARNSYAKEIGIDATLLLKWTKMADLMRIEGIGQQLAELMVLAGIDSVKILSQSVPDDVIGPLQNPGELPVKNLKIDDEFDIVSGKAKLREAAKLMVDNNLPDLVVCHHHKPFGILTFRSIVRAVAEGKNVDKVKVEDVVVKDTPLLEPQTSIEEAAEKLIEHNLPVLPVMNKDELLGVVSRFDIEDAFLKISRRRPSQEEIQRWIDEAKKHKPIKIY